MSINNTGKSYLKKKHIIKNLEEKGIMRTREICDLGVSREYIGKLYRQGIITKVSRGLYSLPDLPITENHSLALTCARISRGVICLLSALRFHSMTTQLPHEVWVAIGNPDRTPEEDVVPLRIVRFSPASLNAGVEEHIIEGVMVKIYNPAKTIADCFKFRNKTGLDVAIEAMRECLGRRMGTPDEILYYGKTCRVANIMRPYLEAMI